MDGACERRALTRRAFSRRPAWGTSHGPVTFIVAAVAIIGLALLERIMPRSAPAREDLRDGDTR